LGELLVEAGIIRPDQVSSALSEASNRNMRIGNVLVLLKQLSIEDLERALEVQELLAAGEVDVDAAVAILQISALDGVPVADALAAYDEQLEPEKPETSTAALQAVLMELAEAEKQHGSEYRELIPYLLRAADLHAHSEDHVKSEQFYKRALSGAERAFGSKSVKVVPVLERLIDLFYGDARYADAEALAWRNHDIVQSTYGADSLEGAKSLHTIGKIVDAQMRPNEAEPFFLSALRVREKLLGPGHTLVTQSLRNLATFWKDKGKKSKERKRVGELLLEAQLLTQQQFTDAMQYSTLQKLPLGQALVKLQMIEEDELRQVLKAQLLIADGVLPLQLATRALAVCAQDKVDFHVAVERIGWEMDSLTTAGLRRLMVLTDELNTAERALGSSHTGVALTALKLGDCQVEQKRYVDAESNYRRALMILEKEFDSKNPEIATGLSKLAQLYLVQKREAEAEPLLWRVLQIRQEAMGKDHVDVAFTLHQIAELNESRENYEAAINFFKSALSIQEAALGRDSAKLMPTLEHLGDCYHMSDRYPEAEQCYRRLVKLKQNALGDSMHPELAPVLDRLAEVYMAQGDLSNAETHCELALEIREAAHGENHPDVAISLTHFARVLRAQKRVKEAEKYEQRVEYIKRLPKAESKQES
jgi:tetratricopeptide (TPR) repeat protein